MSIKQKKNGVISLVPIHASEIQMTDVKGNFKKNNVEGALEELKEDKTNILNEVNECVKKKESIIYKQTFTGAEDLNTIVQNGVYQIADATNIKNTPNNISWSILEVLTSNTYIRQIYSSSVFNITFIRTKTESTWSDWKKISTLDEVSNPNLLINGDFQVWQRGKIFKFDTERQYCADRWAMFEGNFKKGNGTVSKFEPDTSSTELLIRPSEKDVSHYICQSLEQRQAEKLRGKNVTLSVKLRCAYPVKNVNIIIHFSNQGEINLGNGGTSNVRNVFNLERNEKGIYSVTGKVPNDTKGISIVIGGSFNDTTDLDYITVEYAKLEIGDYPTPLVPRLYGEEEMLCKRYYQRIICNGVPIGGSQSTPTNNFSVHKSFPVYMRIAPTVKVEGNILYDNSSNTNVNFTMNSVNVGFDNISNMMSNEQTLYQGKTYGINLLLDSEIY